MHPGPQAPVSGNGRAAISMVFRRPLRSCMFYIGIAALRIRETGYWAGGHGWRGGRLLLQWDWDLEWLGLAFECCRAV